MNLAVHFSSATDQHETPQAFFNAVEERYGPFDLDVCATLANAKCKEFYTPDQDGLRQAWRGRVWCNPPYGREIGRWVERAVIATQGILSAQLAVMLLPSRTDTAWWHDWVQPNAEVEFLRGRLRFGGAKNSAPFPSCLAVFRRPLLMPFATGGGG